MDEREKAMLRLAGCSIARILEDLADRARRIQSGEQLRRPRLTLHLRSGRDLHGELLSLDETPGTGSVVLLRALAANPRAPGDDAVVAAVSAIEAMTVFDASLLDDAPSGSPPARLVLNRTAAALGARLAEALGTPISVTLKWETVEDGAEPGRVLAALLERTEQVMLALSADSLGSEALRRLIRAIELGLAEAWSATISDSTLALRASPRWAHLPSLRELRQKIEAVL